MATYKEIEAAHTQLRDIARSLREIEAGVTAWAHLCSTGGRNYATADEGGAELRAMIAEIYPAPLAIIKARLAARAAKIREQFPGVSFDE